MWLAYRSLERARRQRQLAVRLAIGASRARLMRLVLLETLIVTRPPSWARSRSRAATPADAGTAGADGRAGPRRDRHSGSTRLRVRCGCWCSCAVLLSALVAGSGGHRIDATSVLAHAGAATADRGGRRVQRWSSSCRWHSALVLLSGASVFFRSLHALDQATLGFSRGQLVAIPVTSSISDLSTWNQRFALLEEQIAGAARVQSVGAIYLRPLMGPIGLDNQPIYPGQTLADPSSLGPQSESEPRDRNSWTAFQTMGIRILRGRGFTLATPLRTLPASSWSAKSAARRIWPGRDPLGQRLRDMSYRVDARRARRPGRRS